MVKVNKAGGGNTARTQNFSCLCVYGWLRVTLINEIMAPGPTHSRTKVSNVSRRGVGGYLRSFALHAFVPFCRAAYLSPYYLVPLVTRATSCSPKNRLLRLDNSVHSSSCSSSRFRRWRRKVEGPSAIEMKFSITPYHHRFSQYPWRWDSEDSIWLC